MNIFEEKINFKELNNKEFKEDSVREVIISPILKALGYSAFEENRIVRSKSLEHPYIQFGTRRESIKIIPDYLCEVNGEAKFILNAKAPAENIQTGKNVEQAFSYAIHREVRVKLYALCNGLEFIIFHVDRIEPALHLNVCEIEERWEDIIKILSPIAFLKPHIFNYKPDFGVRLIKSGPTLNFECHFIGAWIGTLGRVNDDLFTFTSVIPFAEECLGSFDFTRAQFDDFMRQVPADKYELIKSRLTSYPYSYHAESKSESFEVTFSCKLGDRVYCNDEEYYFPLKVVSFK